MEQDWERPDRVSVSSAQMNALIERAFPGCSLDWAQVIPTGLANTNIRFRLRESDEQFVLRVHTRDPSAAAREASIVRYLRASPGAAIPVPALRYTCLDASVVGHPCAIWEFVDGVLLQELFVCLPDSELNEIATDCGRVLAGLGQRPFAECGALDAEMKVVERYGPLSKYTEDYVRDSLHAGRAGKRVGEEMREQIWRTVQRHAPRLRAVDGRFCLVHGDFKRSNLLVRKRGSSWSVAAVVDWEFCFAGPPLVDVGNFLRAGDALPVGFRDAFAEGYLAAGGSLPADWLELSRLVDLISQMEFLNRLEERPRVFAETLEVVRETLQVLR
ncbi:MAG: aminoglycoside phosphotransferase family protein [Pirellulaceae bacterium]